MALSVAFENQKLALVACDESDERRAYLEDYLGQVNSYRVIGFFQGSPVYSLYQPPLAIGAGARSLENRLRRRFDHLKIPASATLSITKVCQCACAHCSAVYYNQSLRKSLSKKEILLALQQTMELGVTTLIFLGGEPLLHPDLAEFVKSISPEKATAILFTNGEFFTPAMCEKLYGAGLLGAFVSLDSTVAEEHDRLRVRPGLFHRALQGIENMQRAGLLAGISSYLSHERLEQGVFEEMMDLGKKLGVAEITFFDAIPTGRWIHDVSGCLTLPDRLKIKNLVYSYRKQTGFPGLSVQSTMTSACGSAFCFAANTQFYLTAFGEMCPCDFTPLTIGKFPDQSIQDLWKLLVGTPPYDNRAKSCRMQDPDFREKYIRPIPPEGPFPYPLNY